MFSYLNAGLAVLYLLAFGAGPWLVLLLLGGDRLRHRQRAALGVLGGSSWPACTCSSSCCFFFTGGSFSGLLNLLFAGVLLPCSLHPAEPRSTSASGSTERQSRPGPPGRG